MYCGVAHVGKGWQMDSPFVLSLSYRSEAQSTLCNDSLNLKSKNRKPFSGETNAMRTDERKSTILSHLETAYRWPGAFDGAAVSCKGLGNNQTSETDQ